MIVERENELELLWLMHESGQISATQQNLLCCDNAAYNAFVNGAFYRAKSMCYRLPLFWYQDGRVMVMGTHNCPQEFPVVHEDGTPLHDQYLELMNDEILAATRAGATQAYYTACQAVAELITARERYFAA